jgi:hypothetical protein
MANTITIRVRLEDDEPRALAKLCTRFGYEQAAALSDSPEERRAMESAILKIQATLDAKRSAVVKSAPRIACRWRHYPRAKGEPGGFEDQVGDEADGSAVRNIMHPTHDWLRPPAAG